MLVVFPASGWQRADRQRGPFGNGIQHGRTPTSWKRCAAGTVTYTWTKTLRFGAAV